MKIAHLTSWNAKCGVGNHAKQLTTALQKQGHEIRILTHYDLDKQFFAEYGSEFNVHKIFSWYGRTNEIKFDIESYIDLVKDVDVIHLQYESFIWAHDYIQKIFNLVPNKKIIVEFHSSCIGPGLDKATFNVVHSDGFNLSRMVQIPIGIPDFGVDKKFGETLPAVVSFGLHRNDDKYVDEAMKVASNMLEDPIQYKTYYGDQEWLSDQELAQKISECRVAALIYPPVDASVSSSAACFALGCGIPLLCSDTRWFKHVRNCAVLVESPLELGHIIAYMMVNEEYWNHLRDKINKVRKERSWDVVAQKFVELYQK